VAVDRPTDRIHGWRERLAASPTGLGPFDEALEQLRALVEYVPEERHLIHSDLLNYNVLVADDRLTGVLDWGCGMYGDFLYDLAWLVFWAPWYPAWHGIDFRREAARHYASIGLEVPHFEERLRCYLLHIGLGGQAYSAFKERWAELDATARRTLEVAQVST
jgi:hygromycin-B 4-O-kinase